MFDVLDGVPRLGHAHAFAHDLVQIHQLVHAQQVVDLCLARGVHGHQLLDRRRLVGRVVIDVRIGMAVQPRHDVIDEGLEGQLLFAAVMRPERHEALVAVIDDVQSEQVLQPAFLQRIAFHVEEHVARVGLRHAFKAAQRGVVRVFGDAVPMAAAVGPGAQLQRRLRSQLGEDGGLQARTAASGASVPSCSSVRMPCAFSLRICCRVMLATSDR